MSLARGNGFLRLSEVADPQNPQDAATKAYVDSGAGTVPNGAVTLAKLFGSPSVAAGHLISVDASGNFVDDGLPGDPLQRTGALASTMPRTQVTSGTQAAPTSQTLELVAIRLRKGMQVSKITWLSGTTALATGTNQWFALYSSALALLGVTNDDTSTAWAANTEKQLTITGGPITITSSGLYYLGKLINAATVPTMAGAGGVTSVTGLAPITTGTSTATLTNPASAPNPAAALTATTRNLWAWVS